MSGVFLNLLPPISETRQGQAGDVARKSAASRGPLITVACTVSTVEGKNKEAINERQGISKKEGPYLLTIAVLGLGT